MRGFTRFDARTVLTACYFGLGVLLQMCIQHGVRNLIAHFVGMTLGHALAGEQERLDIILNKIFNKINFRFSEGIFLGRKCACFIDQLVENDELLAGCKEIEERL